MRCGSPSPSCGLRKTVVILWLCFLARGVFYCAALPLWEGFDEYAHFARVQHVASGRWLASLDDRATREVERSIELAPMPWTVRNDPPPHDTYESYWKLPPEERARRERELRELPRSFAHEDALQPVPAESQQPPLSYWLMAAVYRPAAGLSLPARVLVLRLFNLLLTSVAVLAAWAAARRVFADERVAITVAAAVAVFPELMFDGARVSNSALSLALFSVLALLCLDVADGKRRAAMPLGIVLGLGMLSKAFFLCAVPVVALLLLWRRRVLPLAIAAVIPGWWYLMNRQATGSFSTSIQDVALKNIGLADRLRQIPQVDWWKGLDSTFFSHIWFGGWSFLQLRAWMYHVFAVLFVIAAAGVAVAIVRNRPPRRYLAVLAGLYGLFCAGIAYHVLLTHLANGISSSAGWYLCAVIVPEMIFLAAGLRFAPLLVPLFALLDLYGMLFVALPYYNGLIAHRPNGFLEAFHVGQFPELFQRLGMMSVLLAIYLAATLTAALIPARGKPR